jgi:DUF2934 family protein
MASTVTPFARPPQHEFAEEGIDWKAFLSGVSLGDMIRELKSRGFVVWPSDRVTDAGDSWSVRKTILEQANKPPTRPTRSKRKPVVTIDDIRLRAYRIWEAEGRPHGRHEAHWARAESEMAG